MAKIGEIDAKLHLMASIVVAARITVDSHRIAIWAIDKLRLGSQGGGLALVTRALNLELRILVVEPPKLVVLFILLAHELITANIR